MNQYRGDFAIKLAGQQFVLRPTFDALAGLEASAGRGLFAIAQRLSNRVATASEVRLILLAGLAGNTSQVPANFDELLLQEGIASLYTQASAFMASVFVGESGEETAPVDGEEEKKQ